MLVLELLGTLSLHDDANHVPLAARQNRPLSLLALLAVGGKQGMSRHRIESYLWSESNAERARHALDQALYNLRRALGADIVLSTGQELQLNPAMIGADIWAFDEAVREAAWGKAVDMYKGTLLDGFQFGENRELEALVDAERKRLRHEYHGAIERLADGAAKSGDQPQELTSRRKLVASDPLSAGATKKLMLALAAAGDRASAVKEARRYQELVRQELAIEPDAEIASLAATLSRHTSVLKLAPSAAATPYSAVIPWVPPTTSAGPKVQRRFERNIVYAAIALVLLISVAATWEWMRPGTAQPVVRYTLEVDSTEKIAPGASFSGRLALSPDGTRLAYIGGARSQVLLRPRDQLHAIAVPGTEGASTPFFSPDGSEVGFLYDNRIQIAPVDLRTPPITVTDTMTGLAGATWASDGFIYADRSGPGALMRVEAKANSEPAWFTTLDTAAGEYDHAWPEALPGGKGIVFTIAFRGRKGVNGNTTYAIGVADVPSGKHRVIVEDATYARYATSGYLLYVTTNKTLMVVPFDQHSLKLTGKPTALTTGMRVGVFGSADLAVSATGTLVYATGAGEGRFEMVWVTRDGRATPVDSKWIAGFFGFPAISPDGKRFAVARRVTNDLIDIWIKELDGGSSMNLTNNGRHNVDPEWTPDGKSLTFSSFQGGRASIFTKRVDGSVEEMLEARGRRSLYQPQWSPDRKWLVFQSDPEHAGAGDIVGVRPGIDSAPVALVASHFTEAAPAISPDGHWLAYASNQTGQYEVYVVPFPDTKRGTWAISTAGGNEPRWSHRGNELFYRDGAKNFVAVKIETKPTFSVGHSAVLFSAAGYNSYSFGQMYAVAPDDQRFMMIRAADINAPEKLIVVENWFEEMRR